MTTAERNSFDGRGSASSREGSSRRFQFSLFDIAALIALHAVLIHGTLELYRNELTDSDPAYSNGVSWQGGSWPPEIPHGPVVAEIGGGMRFTAFWLRRFAACVVVGLLAIVISFFAAALALKNSGPHVRRILPRLAAALACLLYLSGLAALTYIQHHPDSYIEIDGLLIHPVIHAAWWSVGPAVALTVVITAVEIANSIAASRRSSPGRF